jgi:Transcriptional regulator PadR-like family/FtsX-like permease family
MSKPTDLVQGTLDLLVLKILALEPLHGFALSQRLKQVSGDVLQVSDGSLYPALHKLEQQGWIRAEWKPTEKTAGSLAVSQRTREFGIKMVLGATRAEVFRLVLLRAIRNIAVGLITGIVLAEPALLVLNRLLAGSPLPLHQSDSTVFGISGILLTAVSLIAMYIPATRAMNTDPMQVLRME